MADPLPCPFCGGTAVETMLDAAQGNKWGAALCCECGALGPDVRTDYDKDLKAPWRAEAIAAWNRRVTPPPPASS